MKQKLITKIRITKLFGLYNYDLPNNGDLSDAVIFYGDNGVGKSTLLRLVFHLMSTANDRGHRTALYNADFESLYVTLSSNITLVARRLNGEKLDILRLEIRSASKLIALWEYFPRHEPRSEVERAMMILEGAEYGRGQIRTQRTKVRSKKEESVPQGNEAYLSALSDYVPKMFILNAERKLDSDTVSDPSDEMELRRYMHYDTPKRINELVVRSREIALSQALNSAARWIGSRAIKGTNQGSMNVHSVYVDVLQHLMVPATKGKTTPQKNIQTALVQRLEKIEAEMAKQASYELATSLSTAPFRSALSKSKTKSDLAVELLQPYVRSLESRLEAVEPIYHVLNRFVTTLNTFLRDKEIAFKLSQGFNIVSKLGNSLEPSQLSSGEQQLLLLFSYVLTARDQPSVFMIDEPEISLNVKWQRQLIQSLLDVSENATIQFVFASHSIELLTQHRDRVVKLTNIV